MNAHGPGRPTRGPRPRSPPHQRRAEINSVLSAVDAMVVHAVRNGQAPGYSV